jgi:hypothetical protein
MRGCPSAFCARRISRLTSSNAYNHCLLSSWSTYLNAGPPAGCSTQAGSLAARQVGKQVADVGRAWVRVPPLRQGQAPPACCAPCDALGLRRLLIVGLGEERSMQDDGDQARSRTALHADTVTRACGGCGGVRTRTMEQPGCACCRTRLLVPGRAARWRGRHTPCIIDSRCIVEGGGRRSSALLTPLLQRSG